MLFRSHQPAVAGHLGVGRVVAQGPDEELRHAGDHCAAFLSPGRPASLPTLSSGGIPGPRQSVWELRLSHWRGVLPVLEIKLDWAYRRFHHLWGRFTYAGSPVYGFRVTPTGAPLDTFGRNLYVDTLDSSYGGGWNAKRRGMGDQNAELAGIEARLRSRGIRIIPMWWNAALRQYLQPDGIHFTTEGHRLVATRMLPAVMGAVR